MDETEIEEEVEVAATGTTLSDGLDAVAEGEEGTDTVVALMELSKSTGVELPICRAVFKILYENGDPEEQLMNLFLRSTKTLSHEKSIVHRFGFVLLPHWFCRHAHY